MFDSVIGRIAQLDRWLTFSKCTFRFGERPKILASLSHTTVACPPGKADSIPIPKRLETMRRSIKRYILPPRRSRSFPRAVKIKMSSYDRKRPEVERAK